MLIALYTSRVVLNTLGVEDFGIYNVVGGIVIVFGFLNNAMSASTERFIAFELGKGDFYQLRKIFSTSINIHLIIIAIVLILSETVGLWFFNTQMNIPLNRIDAARWVYHFSIIAFIFNILNVPYHATIIAHEDMNVYALISIVESFLKLLIVFMLNWFNFDKLKLYALLTACVTIVIRTSYTLYCKYKYKECHYIWHWNKRLINEMGSFANWNLLGVFAGIGYNQGVNILINIFFGPTINAARGIAFQVQSAVNSFVTNFQLAVNPAITKSYARNEKEYLYSLVFRATKFSFYLLFLMSMPILVETEFILTLWLKTPPQFVALFCRLILLDILIGSLSGSLQAMVQASGRIKKYQIVVSGILLLNLPISFVLLKLGYGAEYTFYVSILLSVIALISRLIIIKRNYNFPRKDFAKNVLFKISITSLASTFLAFYITKFIENEILSMLVTILVTLFSILLLGLNSEEKHFLISRIKCLLNK